MSVILIKSLVILILQFLQTAQDLKMIHSVVSAHLSKLEVKMILIQLKHRMHSKFAPVSIKCQSPPVSVSSRTVKVKFKIGSGQKGCFII